MGQGHGPAPKLPLQQSKFQMVQAAAADSLREVWGEETHILNLPRNLLPHFKGHMAQTLNLILQRINLCLNKGADRVRDHFLF